MCYRRCPQACNCYSRWRINWQKCRFVWDCSGRIFRGLFLSPYWERAGALPQGWRWSQSRWGALSGWKFLFSPCEGRISNREQGRKKWKNIGTIEQWSNSTMEGRKKKQDQGTGNVLPSLVAGMKYHFYNVFSWGALSGWKSLFSPCEVRISNREHGREK